jgi:hypothetical protein
MTKLDVLKSKLKSGKVYRRSDLEQLSNAVDRHLHELVQEGTLVKVAPGLYHVPKKSMFGQLPAADDELLGSFLKDRRFIVLSPNDYNSLGVGTTQLYNIKRVYNYKRHGDFKLGNRMFHFVKMSYVPKEVTKELLLVDLINNLDELAEDKAMVLEKVKHKLGEMNKTKLLLLTDKFGKVGTRKFFEPLLK